MRVFIKNPMTYAITTTILEFLNTLRPDSAFLHEISQASAHLHIIHTTGRTPAKYYCHSSHVVTTPTRGTKTRARESAVSHLEPVEPLRRGLARLPRFRLDNLDDLLRRLGVRERGDADVYNKGGPGVGPRAINGSKRPEL